PLADCSMARNCQAGIAALSAAPRPPAMNERRPTTADGPRQVFEQVIALLHRSDAGSPIFDLQARHSLKINEISRQKGGILAQDNRSDSQIARPDSDLHAAQRLVASCSGVAKAQNLHGAKRSQMILQPP